MEIDPADPGDAQAPKRRKKDKGPRADAYLHSVQDKKLKGRLRPTERIYADSQKTAAKVNEWLAPADGGYLEAEGMEETWRFHQEAIVAAVETGAAQKVFDLPLPELGPYSLAFSRSGRHTLLGGNKGHLAVMEWQRAHLTSEIQVRETTRDVTFLHNELFYAAAQKKYAYIYDKRGMEVHCLRDHTAPSRLEFLPHHFLLASIGEPGILHYQDTSTGQIVAQHRTRMGPCDVLRQNPFNGVLCTGHTGGTLCMWTPNITTPVVKMLCHRGALKAAAVDVSGRYLVTSGVDCQVKVWDVRTYKPLHAYFANAPATSLDISHKGLLAVAQGRRLQVWRNALSDKAQSPYMTHSNPGGAVRSLHFCPHEDILGIGHASGISTMLVPGAGEANFDAYVANPYASIKERREQEVAQLLDKLQPETIVLDPESIGRVQKLPLEVQKERAQEAAAANAARAKAAAEAADQRTKMKGKNKPTRRNRKKQQNIIDEKKPAIKQRIAEEEKRKQQSREESAKVLESVPRALHRFYK